MKKYLLGFFAIVLAVGFSAFTSPEKPANFSGDFYEYIGPDPNDPNSYRFKVDQFQECDGNTNILCEISAPTSNPQADIDDRRPTLGTHLEFFYP